ncbi:MAG TPA: DUF3341 domain-containing protein [Usitatibacter sp.]|nr:DUF3341 domain-containing protein [Usitatibacter sp.]
MSALYGIMAEFASADALLAAARRAREAGYRRLEAYSPFPVEGLAEAVGFGGTRVPLATLVGGIAGGVGGFFLQWYSAVVSYPENIGGRPPDSWPEFIPVTFETTVLFAAVAAVVAMLAGNRLPRLRHPVFGARDFDLATRNRFFLCLGADDPRFETGTARRFLEGLAPMKIVEVEG